MYTVVFLGSVLSCWNISIFEIQTQGLHYWNKTDLATVTAEQHSCHGNILIHICQSAAMCYLV